MFEAMNRKDEASSSTIMIHVAAISNIIAAIVVIIIIIIIITIIQDAVRPTPWTVKFMICIVEENFKQNAPFPETSGTRAAKAFNP